MGFRSRLIVLLLAVCIALVTTMLLSLFKEVSQIILIATFLISFSASWLLTFFVFEFMIFREIRRINHLFNRVKKEGLAKFDVHKPPALSPLKRIYEQISSYVMLKQREVDALKKMETFRREFVANVSHELKTPIFAAQGFVLTLLDGAVKDKSVRNRFLKKAAKSLDGLDMLVQDLLTLSQIETGEIKMHFETFDIKPLVEDVFDQFENKAEKKHIKLKLAKGTPDQVMVLADWQRINQVLVNLIGNAIKYSDKKGGKVTVRFNIDNSYVTTTIKDSGEGIPPEDVNRIFERFYRVDKSRSREKGGTGLGLAIVKHIMEGHNSIVEVKSVLGQGSEFRFKLPKG
ncbi:MAG: ATP-binding protein [Fulvivirga sp.]